MGTSAKLYIHATIITVNRARDVVLDGALLILGSRILRLGKSHEDFSEYLPANTSIEVIDCSNRIIIPGLVNTHAHLAQSLLRGLAEDLPLHSWLCDAVWPLEASYRDDDGYVAAMLTIAEMLKSGTTCFLEAMLTHGSGIENVVQAVGEAGIRACLVSELLLSSSAGISSRANTAVFKGKLVKSAETNPSLKMIDARDKDVSSMSLSSALDAHSRYNHSFDDRCHIWFACGTPRGSPTAAHRAIGSAAVAHDIGVTMHCAEASKDLDIFREHYECSPLEFCRDTQIAGRKTVLAHVVHPDPKTDFDILRQTGTTVSHNPTSNCKLGSGIAPIPDMIAAGANVSLGTDGAPCNNTYDMIREMHLAAILHSGAREQAGLISALTVLEMATINGARALGLEEEIGSLEVGKKADIVIVNPSRNLGAVPWDSNQILGGGIDPATILVHSCTGADVERVVVNGVTVVSDGKLITLDETGIIQRAKQAVEGIRKRSKVRATNHMGLVYR